MRLRLLVVLLVLSTVCLGQAKPKARTGSLRVTPSAHSVSLTCNPPTTGTTPSGYNFYRGTTKGGENYTTPLNSTPTTSCAFTDTTVVALTTYYYTAESWCPTCSPDLSGPSNEVQVTVPGDPQPNPPVMNTPTGQ